jgi:hypothetical protein
VPALDLALGLRVEWRAVDLRHFFDLPTIQPDNLRCSRTRYR